MSETRSTSYRTVISPLEFTMRLPSILGRLPGIAYNAIKGLRMLSASTNVTWGTVLEDIAGRFPDNPAVKSPDGHTVCAAWVRYADY